MLQGKRFCDYSRPHLPREAEALEISPLQTYLNLSAFTWPATLPLKGTRWQKFWCTYSTSWFKQALKGRTSGTCECAHSHRPCARFRGCKTLCRTLYPTKCHWFRQTHKLKPITLLFASKQSSNHKNLAEQALQAG